MKKTNINISHFCISRYSKYFVICVIGIIMAVTSVFIIKKYAFDKRDKVKIEEEIYTYSAKDDSDYLVNLIPNQYFDSNVMESGGNYIHNLVDSVNINFKYSYQGSDIENITYSYQVFARIDGYQMSSGNKEVIWQKTVPLTDIINETSADTYLESSKEVLISLKQYEDMVRNIKNEFGITLSTDLTVFLKGSIGTNIEGTSYSVNEPVESSVTIPLNTSLINISKCNSKNVSNSIKEAKYFKEKKNSTFLIIGVMTLIILSCVMLLVCIFVKIDDNSNNKDKKEQRHILRKYKDRLVAMSGVPQLYIEDTYVLSSMEDMLKLADEINRPVMYVKGEKGEIVDLRIFMIEGTNRYMYLI